MEKLISIDLEADFGFFRKPDANNTVNLSYNIIHKPAILGILGAVIGLNGYREKDKMPQYYEVLKDLRIGVQPLNDEKGNYQKTNIKYSNTVGYANKGSNYLTEEMTLIKPQFRVFILLDTLNGHQKKLLHNLSTAQSEYIPYFGKNEFNAWWEKSSFREYAFKEALDCTESIRIKTVFLKNINLKENSEEPVPDFFSDTEMEMPFVYFERLPKDFNLDLMQYELGEFVYSTFLIKKGENLKNLYYLQDEDYYVQLL